MGWWLVAETPLEHTDLIGALGGKSGAAGRKEEPGVRSGRIVETLSDPDHVRRSARFAGAKLFSRWYNDLWDGKHVVVVVVSEPDPRGGGA